MTVESAERATHQTVALPPGGGLRRVVLTGFMGAGKSTVGRLLAARLGWEFLDLDAMIERKAGKAVPEIFAEFGEPHFRRLESVALAVALGRSQVVLALGGGTPEVLTNRLLLEQTPGTSTVFLQAPFPALFDRCMLQAIESAAPGAPGTTGPSVRPLLSDPAQAEARFAARQPVYRRLARVTIETADLTPEDTAGVVLARLTELRSGPRP